MKALELTVYPKVDRWVPWSIENYKGETITGSRREYGYETPHGVWRGDEFPEKRLTDAELAAEFWRSVWAAEHTGDDYDDELAALDRFATLPHYDEESA